ncbi:MAG: hypothetical protein LUQ01_02145 [Methanolinea sp.]|nr:hypothetical protein [Methanolinea sp.]
MMEHGDGAATYQELARVADEILERSEEDIPKLMNELDALDSRVRKSLLVSEFLNAYQAYFYFFRQDPGPLEMDRLLLQPAIALVEGVVLTELDLFEVIFRVEDDQPVMSVSDGEHVLVNFRGKESYQQAIRFIDEAL